MSEEEKEAIEELKKVRWNSLAVVVKNEDGKMDISYFTEKYKKTILNLIQKQENELKEKEKHIEQVNEMFIKSRKEVDKLQKENDLMADYIAKEDVSEEFCFSRFKEKEPCDEECDKCVLEYFKKEVEKDVKD